MRHITCIGLGLALLACSGTKPAAESTPTPEPSSGASQVQGTAGEELAEEAAEEVAEEPAAGPATLIVVGKVGNQETPIDVRVLAEDGTLLAQGRGNAPLSVQSGELLIEAQITDSKAIIDKPTLRQYVTLTPGQTLTERLSFARSLVRVSVNLRGKLDPTAVVTLSKDGTPVAKLTSGAEEYVSISPGRYDANVKSQRAEISVSQIILNEGATHNIPLNVN